MTEHPAIDFSRLLWRPLLRGGMGTARDVLYIPELGLQLAKGHTVPSEAVPQAWTLDFEVKRRFQGRAARYEAPFACDRSDQRAAILSNFYSRNFFHWMTEEMIKAAALESQGFDGHYVLHGLPPFAADFLSLLGVSYERMITHVAMPTIYADVSYTPAIDAWAAQHCSAAFELLRGKLREAGAHISPSHGRRIWLERRTGVNNQARAIVNAEEVFALLSNYGFERVDMAALPARQQVAVVSNARVLAGAHGAAFAHALLLQTGAAVIECFAPGFINPGIFDICLINGIDYSMLVHENAYAGYPHGDDVKINLTHLEVILQRLVRQGTI